MCYAGVIRRHRKKIGSCWRKLNPGRPVEDPDGAETLETRQAGFGYSKEELAMVLRPNEATVLYLAACTFCRLDRKADALDALKKAWDAGLKDAGRARLDRDLAILHGDADFERLYPATAH